MQCRSGCGACCIAPSITSAIPGMANGKLAGLRCIQLTDDNRCAIFADPGRPAVCASLKASTEMCGSDSNVARTQQYALAFLQRLECATR